MPSPESEPALIAVAALPPQPATSMVPQPAAEPPLPEPVAPPVQHPPGSLAEALARAAAMPKPKVASAEPKKPVVNPYADIEMPDGDWG